LRFEGVVEDAAMEISVELDAIAQDWSLFDFDLVRKKINVKVWIRVFF
jgi:hypothetical protein